MRKFQGTGERWQQKLAGLLRPHLRSKADWGRVQITRILVVLCAVVVAFTNLASRRSYNWFRLGDANDETAMTADYSTGSYQVFHSLAMAPIADASESISPEEMQRLKKEGEKATVVNQVLVGITNPTAEEFSQSEEDVFIYMVQEGDTVGSIGVKYNINSNTIRWANGLDNVDMIHPGDQLFILPVSGVQHVVKSGDTTESLAKKYSAKTDEIIAFNDLPANGDLKEGAEILIPDGIMPEEAARRSVAATRPGAAGATDTSRSFNKYYYSSGAHSFPWGWCTWYVASRRHVPWGGNAGTWLYHAKAYGANIGRTPRPGAIMVSGESRWGHVGIVESVSGDSFTISEMNYRGFGVVSKRTLSKGSGVVKGFIY
ncbi:MAG: LysM peptidoglycan-binding domain-containing protein [Candidatus Moraniibacteriota bacterium]